MNDAQQIIAVLFLLTGTLAGLTVIWFLLTKISQIRFINLSQNAKSIVQSVEQTMVGETGEVKKNAVELIMSKRFIGMNTIDEIDHYIEDAVFEMNLIIKSPIRNAIKNNDNQENDKKEDTNNQLRDREET